MTSKITIHFNDHSSDAEIENTINDFTNQEICMEVIERMVGTRQPKLEDAKPCLLLPPPTVPCNEVRLIISDEGRLKVLKGPKPNDKDVLCFRATQKEDREAARLQVKERGRSRDLELTINPENYAGIFYFDKP